MSVGAVGMLVLYWIVMAASTGRDPLQFARMLLTSLAPLVAFYLVILVAVRYQAVAVVVALAGVAVTAAGLWYLMGALSPENRIGNQWYKAGGVLRCRGHTRGWCTHRDWCLDRNHRCEAETRSQLPSTTSLTCRAGGSEAGGGLEGVVGEDDRRARAADAGQALHHHPVAVDPAALPRPPRSASTPPRSGTPQREPATSPPPPR